MKKILIFTTAFFLLCCLSGYGQATSITGTITDSNGQLWAGATVILNFKGVPGRNPPFTWSGGSYPTSQTTVADATLGTFTITGIAPNNQIVPVGSSYTLTICPLATTACSTFPLIINYSGTAINISSTITSYITPITTPAQNLTSAYADANIFPVPIVGGMYYNVTTGKIRIWNGTQFVDATGTVDTSNLLQLTKSGGGSQNVTTAVNFGNNSTPTLEVTPGSFFGTDIAQFDLISNVNLQYDTYDKTAHYLNATCSTLQTGFSVPNTTSPTCNASATYFFFGAQSFNNGGSNTSAIGWGVRGVNSTRMIDYGEGIKVHLSNVSYTTALGDHLSESFYNYYFGGTPDGSGEGEVGREQQHLQFNWAYGTISSGGGVGATLLTVNKNAGGPGGSAGVGGKALCVGCLLLNISAGGGPTTPTYSGVATNWGSVNSGISVQYINWSGTTLPQSTAYGKLSPSSCTNNGIGQFETYTSTTCGFDSITGTVTTGLACASSSFDEPFYITNVTGSGGSQVITFNTLKAWNNFTNHPGFMQGGLCGYGAIQLNQLYTGWPVSYLVMGAIGTQLYISSCASGQCNTNKGAYPASGVTMALYPSSRIIGTNGGSTNQAQLAANPWTWTNGDTYVETPFPNVGLLGQRIFYNHNTQSPCAGSDNSPSCLAILGIEFQSVGLASPDAWLYSNNSQNQSATNPWTTFLFLHGSHKHFAIVNDIPTSGIIQVNENFLSGYSGTNINLFTFNPESTGYPGPSTYLSATDGIFHHSLGITADGGFIKGTQVFASHGENAITSVPSPPIDITYRVNHVMLNQNITLNMVNGTVGQDRACIIYAHDNTTTAYTIFYPTTVHGGFQVSPAVASTFSQQCFTWDNTDTIWLADGPGIINQ